MGSGVRSIAANASYSLIGKVLNIGLRLVYVLALARLLGSADYGLFAYALSWYVLFMPLTNLGQDLVLARAIGGRAPDAPEVVSDTFTLRIYATLVVFTFAAGLGWFLNPGEQGRLLVVAVSLAMIPRALWIWCQQVFVASERSRYVLQQDLVFRPLEVVVALAALLAGGGVLTVALVHTGSWVLQAASGLLLVRRRLFRFRLRASMAAWRPLLGDGLGIGVSRLLQAWFLDGPLVLFRHLSGDLEALGLLALAVQVLRVLNILPNALTGAAMPVLGRAMQRGGNGVELFLRVLGISTAVLALVLTGLASLAGTDLVVLAAGASFAGIGPLLPAVCWLAVLPVLGGAALKVVGLQGHTAKVLRSSLLGGLVMTILGVLLIPEGGIAGVLSAMLLGSLVWIIGMSRCMAAVAKLYTGIALGVAVAAGISLWGVRPDVGQVDMPGLYALGVAAGVCLGLVGWWLDRQAGRNRPE